MCRIKNKHAHLDEIINQIKLNKCKITTTRMACFIISIYKLGVNQAEGKSIRVWV